jgi:hypothetical protein
MFSPRYHIGRMSHTGAFAPAIAGAVRVSRIAVFVWPALLPLLLLTALPDWVSAQALGTMQVTARVLPGEPAWAGFHQAGALARQFLSSPEGGPGARRTALVHTRAEVASLPGRRRLLITVQYPRN